VWWGVGVALCPLPSASLPFPYTSGNNFRIIVANCFNLTGLARYSLAPAAKQRSLLLVEIL